MRTGQYDGVSASGNAPPRLVDGGDVDPVNVSLVPNYKTIFTDLKDQPYNTFDGVHYGIPHGRGANLLMWNSNDVKPAPTSWDVMLDPKMAAKYKGKISAYDDPIYIADAAVYLKAHAARPGDRKPLRAERRTVRSGGQPAEGTAALRRRILVRSDQADLGLRQRRQPGRHDLAVPVLRTEGRRQAGRGQPGEPGLPAQGGRDRMVGHLDDQLQGQASQLHVHVDELDRLAESQRRSGGILRRGAGAEHWPANRPRTRTSAPNTTPKTRRSGSASTTGRRRSPTAATAKNDCKDYNDWVQAWTAIKG